MRWLDSIIGSVDMNLSNLWEICSTEKPAMELQKVGHDFMTKQQQENTVNNWFVVQKKLDNQDEMKKFLTKFKLQNWFKKRQKFWTYLQQVKSMNQ